MTARHLTASACVIDPHTRTVLIVWHRASQLWLLPGGHIESGETASEAALREVFEETGAKATLALPRPIDVAVYPAPAKPERPGKPAEAAHEHEDLLFAATADSAAPLTPALDEVDEVRWQPVDFLDDPYIRAEVPRVVALALEVIGNG